MFNLEKVKSIKGLKAHGDKTPVFKVLMGEGGGGWLAPGSDKPHRPSRWLASSQPWSKALYFRGWLVNAEAVPAGHLAT